LSSFELDAIISTIIIGIRTGDNVDIDVPDDNEGDDAGPVKRQAQSSFADLMIASANDPDSTQGYTMSADNAPADTVATPTPFDPKASANNVVASVFFLVLALALF